MPRHDIPWHSIPYASNIHDVSFQEISRNSLPWNSTASPNVQSMTSQWNSKNYNPSHCIPPKYPWTPFHEQVVIPLNITTWYSMKFRRIPFYKQNAGNAATRIPRKSENSTESHTRHKGVTLNITWPMVSVTVASLRFRRYLKRRSLPTWMYYWVNLPEG